MRTFDKIFLREFLLQQLVDLRRNALSAGVWIDLECRNPSPRFRPEPAIEIADFLTEADEAGLDEANQWIDFDDFYLLDAHQTPGDPDAHTSGRGDGHQEIRDGFGSTLLRYARPLPQAAYDPIGGGTSQEAPARALLYSYITRWMRDFRVDGVRMDSVENVSNWDFIQAYKDRARTLFQERWQAAGLGGNFAIVTGGDRWKPILEEFTSSIGLRGRLAGKFPVTSKIWPALAKANPLCPFYPDGPLFIPGSNRRQEREL